MSLPMITVNATWSTIDSRQVCIGFIIVSIAYIPISHVSIMQRESFKVYMIKVTILLSQTVTIDNVYHVKMKCVRREILRLHIQE